MSIDIDENELDLEEIKEYLVQFINETNGKIKGPYGTSYGFGFMPTISYWNSTKVVHFYLDENDDGDIRLYIELNELDKKSISVRATARYIHQLEQVLTDFLIKGKTHNEIEYLTWINDGISQGDSIPHPCKK